jgi:hypothetical protein
MLSRDRFDIKRRASSSFNISGGLLFGFTGAGRPPVRTVAVREQQRAWAN